MIEIVVFCTILLPIFFISVIAKYKFVESADCINKLYEYSKYLIIKIENIKELEDNLNFDKFRNYIKRNKKVFFVVYTNTKVIKAEKIEYFTKEEYDNFSKKLKNIIKNKELKFAFFNLKNANSQEKDFFWSLVNYKNFYFVKYINISNLTYFFGFIIGVLLILFNILNQKTLNLLGIPFQLSLINLFDFGQFILHNNLSIGSALLYVIGIISFSSISICGVNYFFKNKKDNLGDKKLIDISLFFSFLASLVIIFSIFIIFAYFLLISMLKIDFPDSEIKYKNVFITAGDYINYTGYPKIANIDSNKSYIVGYDTNSIYYYDLIQINERLSTLYKKEESKTLKDICKLFHDNKENRERFIILFTKINLKPEYLKSILKKNAKITDERPLLFSDFIDNDIDKKCQDLNKKE